jgi:dCMP deaminase
MAEATAVRADCVRRKVGAVFTYKNRIVATGYNGTKLPGIPGCLTGACPRGQLSYDEQPAFTGYGNCIANHAETNGVEWLMEHTNLPLHQVVVHITCQPCPDCREKLDLHKIAICYPGMPGACPT